MSLKLATVALLVREYDEAIDWFRDVLGFRLAEDLPLGGGKRWVRLRMEAGGAALLLAKADGADQLASVGRSAGGRIAYFLETDDFDGSLARLKRYGACLLEEPRSEDYGRVVKFADLYGNGWDLIEPANSTGEQ